MTDRFTHGTEYGINEVDRIMQRKTVERLMKRHVELAELNLRCTRVLLG